MTFSEADIKSLHRRLDFADAWRYRLDAVLGSFGRRRNRLLSDLPHWAGKLAFDLLEFARTGGRVSHPGRPHLAALTAPGRIPQGWRYRGYWYDATTHSLVGSHLGLDLQRHGGKYYLVESNSSPALKPERRQLYEDDIDPLVRKLTDIAKAGKFERLVPVRHGWTKLQIEEFKLASSISGIDIVPTTIASVHGKNYPMLNPIFALPEKLQERTMYIIFSNMSRYSPVHYLMHSKALVSTWLAHTIEDRTHPLARLACIPAFDRLVLPAEAPDPRWPNLVVKLADSDKATFVVMGRFTTEAEARRDLQLDDQPHAIPGVFRTALWRRALNRLFTGALQVVYQPFVAPDVVANRARRIRLHAFVSPLVNAFLSAHGVLAGTELPDELPSGLVTEDDAYVVNFSRGGRLCRLPTEMEGELGEVAQEFGRCLNHAISRKFQISDAETTPSGAWRASRP